MSQPHRQADIQLAGRDLGSWDAKGPPLCDANVNPCWRPPVPRAEAETTALVEAVDPVRKMRPSLPDSSALDLDILFTQ